jgi:hypothetical protein
MQLEDALSQIERETLTIVRNPVTGIFYLEGNPANPKSAIAGRMIRVLSGRVADQLLEQGLMALDTDASVFGHSVYRLTAEGHRRSRLAPRYRAEKR